MQAAGVYDQAAAACDAASSDANSSLAASVISAEARTFQSAQAIIEALTLLLEPVLHPIPRQNTAILKLSVVGAGFSVAARPIKLVDLNGDAHYCYSGVGDAAQARQRA